MKKIFSIITALALCLTLPPMPAQAAQVSALTVDVPALGKSVDLKDLDSDDYYDIGTADELFAFAAAVNGGNTGINGELTADIVINEGGVADWDGSSSNDWVKWTPIGGEGKEYIGTFDGDNHTISGVFSSADTPDQGLFGRIGTGGTVQKLGVANSYIKVGDKQYAGSVAGQNAGTISNCYGESAVSGKNHIGGIVGKNAAGGTVNNCYNCGTVTGTLHNAGGVVGYNERGIVENCYNIGAVSGKNSVGGVVGNTTGTVTNCYYLTGCAKDDSGTTQYGIGNANSGNNTEDILNVTTGMSTAEIAKPCTVVDYHTSSDYDTYGFRECCGEYQPAVEENDVYQIDNAGQLFWFAQQVNDGNTGIHGELTADIDLNPGYTFHSDGTYTSTSVGDAPRTWIPIGSFSYDFAYRGTFNGNDHTISGVYINNSSNDQGLFGRNYGTVKNVRVMNSYIKGSLNVGSVAGFNHNGTIENCRNEGYIVGSCGPDLISVVGGIVGRNVGIIKDCHNSGKISGEIRDNITIADQHMIGVGIQAGGVTGINDTTVENCSNTGEISGTIDATFCGVGEMDRELREIISTVQIGGLAGLTYGGINNCFNVGGISGTNTVAVNDMGNMGGMVGMVEKNFQTNVGGIVGTHEVDGVVNCYNWGSVNGSGSESVTVSVGGVVGLGGMNNYGAKATNCYNFGSVSGSGAVNGVLGQVGRAGYTAENCYYLANSETDSIDGTTFKTSDQFASGEVAYLLQGEQATDVWGQDITGETANERDAYPVLGGARVNYGYISCANNAEMVYTNGTAVSERVHSLTYSASGNTIAESCSSCSTVSNTATITAEDAVYNGSAHETAAVAYSQNWAGGELSPSYENNTDAGTATASITHGGKTASVNFTIAPKTVIAPVFAGVDANYPHTGEAIQPSGFTLKDDLDNVIPEDEYTVAYSNNTNVGTATITITDREGGNYIVSGTTTFEIVAHSHDWTYTASGATITAICDGAGTCGVGGTATVTLVAPENLVYDGNAKTATISGSIENVDLPAIQYTGNCADVGEHTATLTLGGATATLTFSVTEPAPTTSTVTVSNGGTGASGSGTYAEGDTVTISAGTKNNYRFTGWTSADGVTFASASSATTTFTMPGDAVTVTANWTYLGGGGGGTSSSTATTTTTKNPDGSTTTTVTDKNTGTVTETTKNTDGTTGTVVTDKNGNVTEITASVSDKAAKEAAKTEEAVTLPVEVPASTNTNDAPIVEVTMPKNAGSVKVEIPVEEVTPGTVAIIVKADGTEEIVSTSIPTENGVLLTVDGSTTIKVIDNAKEFSDVSATSWAKDAIAFASARGITGGTSDTTFSPGASCTRAQIVTFLWRAAGSPVVTSGTDFSDVSADAYYAAAVRWAVSMGITTGTGNGTFNPDATCTRAQAMTFIYRNEQAQGGGMQGAWMIQNPFADVNLENYYGEAVMWAVINSVTNGTSDTTFSPNATCTRAQIVTFLYNYLVK